jgi:hypothetical protein
MEKNLIKLQQVSEMAKKFTDINKVRVYTLYDDRDTDFRKVDQFSFHPNGKCGCIELNDDDCFGIRCNHLMWAEGSCEGYEYFFNEEGYDSDETRENVIIVYGNHKGWFVLNVIVYEF